MAEIQNSNKQMNLNNNDGIKINCAIFKDNIIKITVIKKGIAYLYEKEYEKLKPLHNIFSSLDIKAANEFINNYLKTNYHQIKFEEDDKAILILMNEIKLECEKYSYDITEVYQKEIEDKTFIEDFDNFSDDKKQFPSIIPKIDNSYSTYDDIQNIIDFIVKNNNYEFIICNKCKKFKIINFIDEDEIIIHCFHCEKTNISKQKIKHIIKQSNGRNNNTNFNKEENSTNVELSELKKSIKKIITPYIQSCIEKSRNEKTSKTESFINPNEVVEGDMDDIGTELLYGELKLRLPPFIELIIKISSIVDNSENYIKSIRNIWNFLNYKDKSRLLMVYKGKKGQKKALFDQQFIKNNENNIEIYVDQIKYNRPIYEKVFNDEFIIVILVEKNKTKITNMSKLFYGCEALIWLNGKKWDTSNVTNMNSMFENCYNIEEISDISKWNINKVTQLEYMFKKCYKLTQLDLPKSKTENLISMKGLFYECLKLRNITGIDDWSIEKVTDISEIFSKCSALQSLPEISKWKTANVMNMAELFSKCSALQSLPDLSKWETPNVINMAELFSKCTSLKRLPIISNWETENLIYMNGLLNECKKLIEVPDISNWKTSNVTNMSYLFNECESLQKLPDLSKWELNPDLNTDNMFYGLKKIKKLPKLENGKFVYH